MASYWQLDYCNYNIQTQQLIHDDNLIYYATGRGTKRIRSYDLHHGGINGGINESIERIQSVRYDTIYIYGEEWGAIQRMDHIYILRGAIYTHNNTHIIYDGEEWMNQ